MRKDKIFLDIQVEENNFKMKIFLTSAAFAEEQKTLDSTERLEEKYFKAMFSHFFPGFLFNFSHFYCVKALLPVTIRMRLSRIQVTIVTKLYTILLSPRATNLRYHKIQTCYPNCDHTNYAQPIG
jgi:hypothetical protein